MATKKEATTVIDTDLFEGLMEESQSSAMTVWSKELEQLLAKEPSVKFAEGKRAAALEAVHKWAKQQELNPIVRYVLTMGLKTLNRKVGK